MNRCRCGIYQILNIVTGDFYIGQSVDLVTRKSRHFSNLAKNEHVNKHLQNAYNTYGADGFVFRVLLYCERNELLYYEQGLVDRFDPHYNIQKMCVNSPAGIKRGPVSEETRRKMSELFSGKPLSEEHRQKLSDSHQGPKPWLRGRKFTEEHRQKLSDKKKGLQLRLGSKASEETRRKLSESHKGQKAWNRGRTLTDDQKKNMRGYIRTPEQIQKYIAARKGYRASEETRRRQSEALKGKPSWCKGKKLTEEQLKKRMGRKQSQEQINKRSASLRRRWLEKKNPPGSVMLSGFEYAEEQWEMTN